MIQFRALATTLLMSAAFIIAVPVSGQNKAKKSQDNLPAKIQRVIGENSLKQFPVSGPTSSDDWLKSGADEITKRLAEKPITKRAKNIILVVGDGMGVSTLTAGRIYAGQLEGRSGEEGYLSFEEFPYSALVKTYNTDAQTADSAGTASAMNTGVKTRIGVINTPPEQPSDTCEGTLDNRLKTIAQVAEEHGMATGIVSSARLTHATPAAVYAVASSRNWESDISLPEGADITKCPDIAQQLVSPLGGNGLEVALGGGRGSFIPTDEGGRREDGRNIVDEFLAMSDNAAYATDRASLAKIDPTKTDKIIGLFKGSHLSFELDKPETEPTLVELAEVAVKRLSQNPKGFYLMIEGGRVDHAHHNGNAARALEETRMLSETVAKIASMVDLSETLILVTADHSHTFTIAGYPRRGNNILSVVVAPDAKNGEPRTDKNDRAYTTLGYANGRGAVSVKKRPDVDHKTATSQDFQQQALVRLSSETHGGEDVGLFAVGPWAHLVRGTMEQHLIYHIMLHAITYDNPEN